LNHHHRSRRHELSVRVEDIERDVYGQHLYPAFLIGHRYRKHPFRHQSFEMMRSRYRDLHYRMKQKRYYFQVSPYLQYLFTIQGA